MEKIVSSKILGQGKIFELKRLQVELGSGKVIDWDVISTKGSMSVAIIALDKEKNIYLVEEYMAAVDKRLIGLPKGSIDKGEEILKAAARELKEETGTEGEIKEIMEVYAFPGSTDHKTAFCIATDVVEVGREEQEDEHHLIVKKMPLSHAVKLVTEGKIPDARSVAGILLADKLAKKI